jgi:hypothetical protein
MQTLPSELTKEPEIAELIRIQTIAVCGHRSEMMVHADDQSGYKEILGQRPCPDCYLMWIVNREKNKEESQ